MYQCLIHMRLTSQTTRRNVPRENGFYPRTKSALQTAALPLGYPAESGSQSRFAGFPPILLCLSLPIVANFRRLGECRRISGRQLRIIPYNGNRAYKYYLDGYKVNGKRKRLFFKDEATANRKLAELAKQQKKRGAGRPRCSSRPLE